MSTGMSAQQPSTLIELLQHRTREAKDRGAYIFLEAGEEAQWTYGELDRRSRAIGAMLQELGAAGERVVLLYPPGLEYIAGFFGCLYGGAVAVPAYPPDPSRLERTLPRLMAIIRDSQASVVLTTGFIAGMAEGLCEQAPELKALKWVATDELEAGVESSWRDPGLGADSLAFLQYTSGSTGTPKGVMLSHGNLLSNLQHIKERMEQSPKTRCAFWLPPYHDMGLIGGILSPLNAGCEEATVLMAPMTFLKHPVRWLEAISRFRVTLSGAPNFAYDLCVRKTTPEQREELDLSCWTVAFSGAEHIRAETLDRFIQAFAPSKFNPRGLYGCYGLAEATLLVTGDRKGELPVRRTVDAARLERLEVHPAEPGKPGAVELVSSGLAPTGQQVLIVDPDTCVPCPPHRIGEVWVKGPNVARGYWNRPEESERTLHARLATTGEGPFLRTGDLGFMADGELFLASRIKDLIILRGRNHYPQDLELTVERSHPALRPGCTACFSVEAEGEERLVVVQEVDARQAFEPDEAIAAIRREVALRHDVQVYAVSLIATGSIHKTTSGKIQRRASKMAWLDNSLEAVHVWRAAPSELPAAPKPAPAPTPAPAPQPPAQPAATSATERQMQALLVELMAETVSQPAANIDVHQPFVQYGLDSVASVRLVGELESRLGRKLPATLVWEHPNIEALARHLAEGQPQAAAPAPTPREQPSQAEPIAIVGMGCRFPGADGLEAFWKLLSEGVDAIREVPRDRWDVDAYYDPDPTTPGKMNTRWGGFLEGLERFDRSFFGISPREAARMDPQQRLLLEVAWEALENAGIVPEKLARTPTGVFVGISHSDYGVQQLAQTDLTDAYAGTGNALSIAANRLSYLLDLKGPSLAVDTACSSSLVALHLACRSLRSGESTVALVAGANVLLSPELTVNFSKAGFMAPDGRCKPFDASANGYVRSEGVGMIVLKPLSQAKADGNRIYAVIRGSAVNQDGRSNGLTAPNRQAQEAVLREAYRDAGVAPAQVSYTEAHGTGTALGDPIEAMALGTVLAEGRAPGSKCALGSLKSNVGHMEAAAGIGGIIKTALSLHRAALPPTLHYRAPNPHIPFSELPLRVVHGALEPWPEAQMGIAVAGVSGFGFGGTNAHVVLASAPKWSGKRRGGPGGGGGGGGKDKAQLLPVSARNPDALKALAARYLETVEREGSNPERLEALFASAALHRTHHAQRLAVRARTAEELAEGLRAFLADQPRPGVHAGHAGSRPKVAFVFSGQGPQWWAMGRGLLAHEPVFRQVVEQCDELLRPLAGWSLLEVLNADEGTSLLTQTEYAQPALFALQVGLAALWRSLGVEPDAVVGHSIGEVAAAHVAGALTLPQAIHLVYHRGRLMQSATGQGKMALVELPPREASALLRGYEDRLSLAAHNGPASSVLSGEAAALDQVLEQLAQRQVPTRRLPVDYAFHSPQMEELQPDLAYELEELQPARASLTLVSTALGRPLTGLELGADYWAGQMRMPVLFAPAIEQLADTGHSLFVEVGPHPVLSVDIQQVLRARGREAQVLPSLRRKEDDHGVLLSSLGALYCQGLPVEWRALHPDGAASTVDLPTYAWQRERCWVDDPVRPAAPRQEQPPASSQTVPAEWLYDVRWEPAPSASASQPPGGWLVLADSQGVGEALAGQLRAQGAHVTLASRSTVPSGDTEALVRLLQQARAPLGDSPLHVAYLWSLEAELSSQSSTAELHTALSLCAEPVLHLLQALSRSGGSGRLWLVTRGAQSAGASVHEASLPQSTLWGFGRTLAAELPERWGGMVDLEPGVPSAESASQLASALRLGGREDQLALRRGQPLVARLVPRPELASAPSALSLRTGGAYLITGGLGGLGLRMARWLVSQGARRLVLLGRTPLPSRSQWKHLPSDSPQGRQVRAVRELESLGASVHLAFVDVADEAAFSSWLQQYRDEEHPSLVGVVHAAGVLGSDNEPLLQLQSSSLHSVLRPKALGAWLLHRLLGESLELFVCFSSSSTLLGNPGQGHYSAANAFLDALAHARRSRGLPALSLDYGTFAEAGMATRGQGERLEQHGMRGMSPERAFAAIGPLLSSGLPQAAVMDVDWPRLRALVALLDTRGEQPFLSRVPDSRPASPAAPSAPVTSARVQLPLEPAARRAHLQEWLHAQAATVLGMAPSALPSQAPLNSLGFDSIMSIELRNRVQSHLGLSLPLTELVQGPSVSQLLARLLTLLPEPQPEQATPSAPPSAQPPLVPQPPEAPRVLSFGQERLWFLHQLDPDTSFHNIPAALRLKGQLDVRALERGLQDIQLRHEALRTTFRTDAQGTPHPVVSSHVVPLAHVDLGSLPPAEREQRALRLASEAARAPFALATGPLVRCTLLRLSDSEHVLLFTMHHTVSDGWSLGVLVRELVSLYEAYRQGQPSPLPPLPVQYTDFAAWQRQWLQGESLRSQLDYWRKQLAGAPALLELPTDRPRPPEQTHRGTQFPLSLGPELARAVHSLARAEGVTPYMVLLATFKLLLARHSGQRDLSVGTPIAGRNRPEVDGLIGFFPNNLVLRTQLSPQATFRELLAQVREAALGAYAHQDVPFEKLVEELQPTRSLSYSPLFQVMFILRLDPLSSVSLPGLSLHPLEMDIGASQFDLTLSLGEDEHGLSGWFEYNTDLFDASSIARLAGHYRTLLEAATVHPGQHAFALPLLTPEERRQLLVEWNDTRRDYAQACVHELFEAQVQRTPDAVALTFEDRSLTYRELAARSRQLAWHLRSLGVGPDSRVGVSVERSIDMVVALLGVLQAGGAYVPLDPSYPQDRLAYMLEDSRARVLLTQRHLSGGIPSQGVRSIFIEELPPSAAHAEAPPASGAHPDNVAYTIYTSGSTGRPKGVMVPHRTVANFFTGMDERLGTTPGTWLAITSISFDISVLELLWTLCRGFRVVLRGENVPSQLRQQSITHLQCTPSFARALALEPQGLEALSTLQRLMVGGEALPESLASQLRRAVPHGLMNMYGPTETTIWSSTHQVSAQPGPVPIGTPIANTALYVLDAWLQPQPVGVAGELFIGGTGVVRGYLERPELSAERFIPDPFWPEPGARMYRTGDLARWRADGTVEFLGRLDHQVKVRGFRIELGEIEAVLGQHPSVQTGVVVAREDGSGDKRLVAYVVPKPGHSLEPEALRAPLKARLPEYMVPSVFMVLEALPLTPNGKVDRKALPEPDAARPRLEVAYVAPRTPVEELLAQMWSGLLGVERVGIHDGFFELGGHSLLATQVFARLRSALQVELPLRTLFEDSTVAKLAARVEAIRGEPGLQAPPLRALPRTGEVLPLSFGQERLWFLQQLEPDSPFYNVPAALRLSGPLDVKALERSLLEVRRRHEVLRITFRTDEQSTPQLVPGSEPMPWSLVDLSHLPTTERESQVLRMAEEESRRLFDLKQGALLRGVLLRLSDSEHVLLVTMHHTVSDGWSLGVLVREVAALYTAFSQEKPSPLPELAVQYADFAAWQRQWLRGETLQAHLGYWRQQLAGAPELLELPTDRPRPHTQSYRGAQHPLLLGQELTRAVRALALGEGVTPFMVLMATFQLLISRYSGQQDLSVGTPIAGRTRPELEELIGFFVNTLVMRTQLPPHLTFRELLARVREVAIGAYAHQDVPFEKLVEELKPARSLSYSPLFQVMFVLQQNPLPTISLPGLALRRMQIDSRTSQFDLSLSLIEEENGLTGWLSYSTDLFDASTAARLADHYRLLLEAAVAHPEQRIGTLPLLTAGERQRMLVEWNATHTPDSPLHACVHELLEAQAERRPDAIAASCEGQSLTYRELNQRSNRVAHRLLSEGVALEGVVALLAERGLDFLSALFGTFKSGGAYMPLDVHHPAQRMAQVLEQSRAGHVLVAEAMQPALAAALDKLPAGQRPRVLVLEQVLASSGPDSNPPRRTGPEHLAYVLFTSGSTGLPKGAMLEHRGMLNHSWAFIRAMGISERDTVAQTASQSFDISIWQMVTAALVGGRVHVLPTELVQNGTRLLRAIEDERLSIVQLVPSLIRVVLEEGDSLGAQRPALSSLRWMVPTGEALPPEVCRHWLESHPSVPLLNAYGPTECSDDVTLCVLRQPPASINVPIGKPLDNLSVYVLDASLQPVPTGVSGELCIGGLGVGRGYLRDPARTAEVFLPDPFSSQPGARLYRTGDLVRWLADGNIEYLGRIDHQVKVRGFRIELGEIESVLVQHPALKQAVVLAREDSPGHKRLVAYGVAKPEQTVDTEEVRRFIRERLPEYMVPAVVMVLDAMPLTSVGKVDRKALPAPELSAAEDTYVAPRTPVEKQLAAIWQQVLRVERVGLHDGFFDLGGDSILSLQIVARARRAGLHLTPKHLFQHQTLAELATAVSEEQGVQGPVSGTVPLTPIQRWMLEQELPRPGHFNQAVLLQAREAVDAASLQKALQHVVDHHDALRLSFVRGESGAWLQENLPLGPTASLVRVDLSATPDAELPARIETESTRLQASFDLGTPPLLCAALFDLGAQRPARLLLVAHHLVMDGVSWRVLLEDLATAYAQLRLGQPVGLPPKSTSFKTWAERLVEYARSEALASEQSYWLAEARQDVAPLPTDKASGPNTVASARCVTVSLDAEETRLLLQQVPAAYRARLDDVLLAALQRAVTPWSGQSRLLVDLEGHGRDAELFNDVKLSRTVGCINALYPVLLESPTEGSGAEAVRAVRRALRQVPRHGLGYGLLRYLREDETSRRLRALPQASVRFSSSGQLDAAATSDSPFEPARESTGAPRDEQGPRSHLLEIDGLVREGRLELKWTYSDHLHARATIERLAQAMREALRALIAGRSAPEASRPIAADFPLARLEDSTLESLLRTNPAIEDIYPLTLVQQGMLFHAILAPTSGVYVEQFAWSIHSRLDLGAMRRAWEQAVQRHSSLRTAFFWEGLSQPLQVVRPRVELPWQELDWRDLPEGQQQARFETLMREDRTRGFDLTRAPLMRVTCIQLGENTHQFLWTSHHLQLDGWAIGIFFRDLFSLYEAELSGQPARLEPSPAYSEYIAWLQRQDTSRSESFWRGTLEGFTTPTPLPADLAPKRLGAAVQQVQERQLSLSPSDTAALQAFARKHQLTLNTLSQAAWALLLWRYTGEQDVVFGTTVSGRPPELSGIESMVGLFINTLPARVQMRPDADVMPWLRQLQARQLELRQHEYSPLVQVQAWSEVPRGTPLFESLLVFENHPIDASVQQGAHQLEVRVAQTLEHTNYPLTAMLVPGESLQLRLAFDTERFDAGGITRLMGHWHTALKGLVAHADQRLSDISLLSEQDRNLLLAEWNDTRREREPNPALHRLIEAQVDRTPGSIAVDFEGQCLTYRELDTRANQLAHALRSRGVGPEVRVALCMERSVELVVALVGVLKAGGAYVPLDPTLPPQRLSFLMEDCGARIVLTQQRHADKLPRENAEVLCLDTDWEALTSHHSQARPNVEVGGANLAYVIYTSGSTGQPKGAMNSHEGICNRLQWMQETYGLTSDDRFLQKTPYSFDVSVWEFFNPLLVGARLVVAKPGGHQDSAYLVRLIVEKQLTTVHFVPSMLGVFLEEQGLEKCTSVRRVVCSGEALPAELQVRCLERLGAELHNLYGPTEASVEVTAWTCVRGDRRSTVPIGYPIANVYMRILDERLELVPPGVTGELHIGGIALARGYVGRPSLTADRFIPDPFGDTPGARLYKTGDLARYLPDGSIEYQGRTDFQLKLRGFRIEPGEIEATLARHPSVSQVVVIAREDSPGNKRLVAYVVPTAGHTMDAEALRTVIKASLPEYMVPSAFVSLEAMPITTNGKLDRRALPVPDVVQPLTEYVAPRTAVEQRLAGIWAQVLGLPRVSLHDDFFALGGDSILSLQIVARARQAGFHLTPKHLFERPTLAELASVISVGQGVQAEQGPVSGPVPLTPIQHWMTEMELPRPGHFNQAVLLQARETVEVSSLEKALQHVVEHHDALRMSLVRGESGAWLQENLPLGPTASLVRVDLSATPDAELPAALEAEATSVQASLDLGRPPLLRASLFDLGAQRPARLMLVVHHLVVDGVSWRVLLEDLATAYAQLRRGQPVSLPSKSTSFKAWAERLVEYARSETLTQEASWWLSQPIQATPLPQDKASGENTSASTRTVTVSLDAEETRLLLQQVPTAYRAHINDVLLATLVQSLAPWTGQSRLLVDLEGHGREELFQGVDLSRTVGWFTALYPVMLEVPASASPSEAVRSVRRTLRQVPQRGIGYGLLRYLRGDELSRQLRTRPQAPVVFNYLGQFDATAPADSAFAPSSESSGPASDARNPRPHQLEVEGMVLGGRLELQWIYSDNLHERSTVETLARRHLEALRTLIAARHAPESSRPIAADFPLARLDDSALERLLQANPDIEDLFPLSHVQQGMLFHALLAPSSGVYVEQHTWSIHSSLDLAALRHAWEQLIQRHAVLRTSFVWEGLSQPLQVVRSHVATPWQELDWRQLSPEQQRAHFDSLLKEDRARGFDFTQAPLMRLVIIRTSDDSVRILWNQHHLLLDGWSVAVLLKELFALYDAALQGQTAQLEPAPAWRDYISWLQRQDVANVEPFWRRALQDFSSPTPLPAQVPGARVGSTVMRVDERSLHLSAQATSALQAFARKHQLTLNILTQAAWAFVLSRYSGEQDVVFGTTVSGRPPTLPGIESMVGLFINTLPARVRVPPQASLVPWLQQLQDWQLELRQHEHSPLVQVQSWSGVPHGTPLFESLFVFENYPIDASIQQGVGRLEVREARTQEQTNYALTACAVPGEALELRLTWDAERFDAAGIARLLEHWRIALEGLASNTVQHVGELPLLTDSERHQLLVQWNDTRADFPRELCVHHLLEAQASRSPEALAVVSQEAKLTFAELERRSNQLAFHLRSLGVGPDCLVGLFLERNADLVVGLLGILKAGAAYLPLDPAYPAQRLSFMLEDSRAKALVTHSSLAGRLSHSASTVCLDSQAETLSRLPSGRVDSGVLADHLAYVIYTSGSTGRPKGVLVEHRGVLNYLTWALEAYAVEGGTGSPVHSSVSFDLTVTSLLAPLAAGRPVVLVPEDEKLEGLVHTLR
ncbi:non-ribosomal peptide synthase/polyketide synthase, partial [Archangium lipolyticum]|uniref:non-ribosomal peptide synthase/polyketide synthase n=1 Tax=Archangium lipolyticum TaxID=2970465 RepID=UPI00214A8A29